MKFSDSPYFLLQNYFDSIVGSSLSDIIGGTGVTPTISDLEDTARDLFYHYHCRNEVEWTTPNYWDTTDKILEYRSYLRGGRTTIIARGYWTDLYVKTEDVGFIGHKFAPFPNQDHINGNFFRFLAGDAISVHSQATSAFNNGDEVYFRKDSLFHTWLAEQPIYKPFINQNKKWVYFGKIYKIGEPNKYHIEYNGMKDYALRALPDHNQTDGMMEWLKVYFDQVYHQIYNKMKNVNTLIDPREIDIEHLEYLANIYKMNVRPTTGDRAQRDWVESLTSLLKRKGTYSSIYIPWNVLFGHSLDPLNIYERWHAPSASGDPSDEFVDSLYTLNYGVSGEGYAGGEYYNMSFGGHPNPYHLQRYQFNPWTIFHNMETTDIITQVYNTHGARTYPIIDDVYDMSRVMSFDNMTAGDSYTMKISDFDYPNLANKVDWYESNVWSGGIQDEVWSQAVSGDTSEDNVDWLHYHPSSDSTWTASGSANIDRPVIQFFDLTHTEVPTGSVTYSVSSSASSATASFEVSATFIAPQDGYALITQTPSQKAMEYSLPTYGPSGMILSTHYRIELDLSYEPMTGDEIMSEEMIQTLLTEWEVLQPISRYAHYSYVISPIVDFTGGWISTDAHQNSLVTKYVAGTEIFSLGTSASSAAPIPTAGIETTVHLQKSLKDQWDIYHGFDTKDLIVQCFDMNDEKMEPSGIEMINNDAIRVLFETGESGEAYITAVQQGTDTSASSNWNIAHALNKKEVLAQHFDSSYEKMVPTVQNMGYNNINAVWDSPTTGRTVLIDNDFKFQQVTSSDTWTIQHNFGVEGLVIQFFDSSDQLIRPNTVTIVNTRKCIATFDSAVSGWAVMKEITGGFNDSLLMEDIYNGGYWQIGDGDDVSYDPAFPVVTNSLQSMLASGTDLQFAEDNDYYYISWEYHEKPTEDIRELGIFNKDNFLIFYTRLSNLHKPDVVDLNVHFKIEKRT